MQFEKACNYILNKLANQLPDNLIYHGIGHTNDVFAAAKHLATVENFDAYETQLLLTAACYHDSGFLECTTGHELVSCEIARKALPGYGYTVNEINRICGIIMATQIPQRPKDRLEEILSDADLDYLGRDDFDLLGNKLFLELLNLKKVHSKNEWNKIQIEFMENHHYFSNTSIKLRQLKKEKNLELIKTETLVNFNK